MSFLIRHVCTATLMFVLACGDDTPADAGSDRDAGETPLRDAAADVADAAISPDAAGPMAMPLNDSFETARVLDLAKNPPLQDVKHAGQSDYYSFEGEAGAFYALSTEIGQFTPDTIIDLYDPDQELLAENDDGERWPGDATDSRLVVRLARSGTHYVRVQNHINADPVLPPVFYHLTVQRLDVDAENATLQPSDEPAQVHFAHDAKTGYAYTTLIGDFATVHLAAFDVEAMKDQVMVGHVLPVGPQNSGSTAAVGLVRITDDDDHALGQIDGRKHQEFVHPPLGAGTYHVTAELVNEPGDNGFFAIDVVLIGDNPREQADADNDAFDSAEEVEFQQGRALLLASLASDDVDYFTFEHPVAGSVTVVCEAESGGSGVRGLHAELRDADDKVLTAADEVPETNLAIENFSVPEAGTYYLRLSSTTKTSDEKIEPWVRCVILLGA
jgi:hypothetical protein